MAADVVVRVEPDEDTPEFILITGICPRCGHSTAHVEPVVVIRSLDDDDDIVPGMAEIVREAARRAGATLGERERDVDMPCDCGTPHPGAPDGVIGCGARWSLRVEWGVRAMAVRVSPGPPKRLEDHLLFEALRVRLSEELRHVRSVAASWRAALAAMLALVATVSVVRGRDSIAGIGPVARILVGAFLLGALVSAAVGAFLSSRSAFGLPREEDAPRSVTELVTTERARVRRAVGDLSAAIVLTFVTLALIVASVGVAWYS